MIIKTNLIDWQGVIEGGVAIYIGITIDDNKTYESLYWIHPDGSRTLQTDKEFLKLFNVENEEELIFYDALLDDIDSILPDKKQIFELFLNSSTSGII